MSRRQTRSHPLEASPYYLNSSSSSNTPLPRTDNSNDTSRIQGAPTAPDPDTDTDSGSRILLVHSPKACDECFEYALHVEASQEEEDLQHLHSLKISQNSHYAATGSSVTPNPHRQSHARSGAKGTATGTGKGTGTFDEGVELGRRLQREDDEKTFATYQARIRHLESRHLAQHATSRARHGLLHKSHHDSQGDPERRENQLDSRALEEVDDLKRELTLVRDMLLAAQMAYDDLAQAHSEASSGMTMKCSRCDPTMGLPEDADANGVASASGSGSTSSRAERSRPPPPLPLRAASPPLPPLPPLASSSSVAPTPVPQPAPLPVPAQSHDQDPAQGELWQDINDFPDIQEHRRFLQLQHNGYGYGLDVDIDYDYNGFSNPYERFVPRPRPRAASPPLPPLPPIPSSSSLVPVPTPAPAPVPTQDQEQESGELWQDLNDFPDIQDRRRFLEHNGLDRESFEYPDEDEFILEQLQALSPEELEAFWADYRQEFEFEGEGEHEGERDDKDDSAQTIYEDDDDIYDRKSSPPAAATISRSASYTGFGDHELSIPQIATLIEEADADREGDAAQVVWLLHQDAERTPREARTPAQVYLLLSWMPGWMRREEEEDKEEELDVLHVGMIGLELEEDEGTVPPMRKGKGKAVQRGHLAPARLLVPPHHPHLSASPLSALSPSTRENEIFVDACAYGVGFIYGERWLAWTFTPGHPSIPLSSFKVKGKGSGGTVVNGNINMSWAELVAAELGLRTLVAAGLRDCVVVLRSDNGGVVNALKRALAPVSVPVPSGHGSDTDTDTDTDTENGTQNHRSAHDDSIQRRMWTPKWGLDTVLARIMTLCVSAGLTVRPVWVWTRINPADKPSRGVYPDRESRMVLTREVRLGNSPEGVVDVVNMMGPPLPAALVGLVSVVE